MSHSEFGRPPEFDAWVRYDQWDAKALAELLAARVASRERRVAILRTESRLDTRDSPLASGDSPLAASLWTIFADDQPIGTVSQLHLDAPIWAAPAYGIELSMGVIDSSEVAPRGKSDYRPFGRAHPSVA